MADGALAIRCGCDKVGCCQAVVARAIEGNGKVRFEVAMQGSIILSHSDAARLRDWLDKFVKKGARKGGMPMSEKWTPEILGQVLTEMDEGGGDCSVCPIEVVCDEYAAIVCEVFGGMLRELNKLCRIPAPEHVCRCSKEEQCSHS